MLNSEKFGNIVGFENHGGRTYHNYETLGNVVVGYGNNDEDKKEGILYNNFNWNLSSLVQFYPKNPNVTDYLIKAALDNKYGTYDFIELNNDIELNANKHMVELLKKICKINKNKVNRI